MFRTFEAQHVRVMQMQLRMCVVEKETSVKIFLQTETPVSPVWSSDELSPQGKRVPVVVMPQTEEISLSAISFVMSSMQPQP